MHEDKGTRDRTGASPESLTTESNSGQRAKESERLAIDVAYYLRTQGAPHIGLETIGNDSCASGGSEDRFVRLVLSTI